MTYPPPPWTIQGHGFLSLHLLDVEQVRSVIPDQFQVISVFPGKTVGGVLIASYGATSTLIYNELIVVSGLVSCANQVGSWISHIYVDNPDSVAGGRAIWGLPKELAHFQWNLSEQPSVHVTQNDRTLCQLYCQWRSPSFPIPSISAPVLSLRQNVPLQFQASGTFKLRLIGSRLDIPSSSPFALLNLGQAWLSVYSDRLSVVAGAPTPILL